MFDDCIIDRYFVDVGEGNGSSPQHVMLDDLGAKVVGGLLNVPMNRVKWSREMNEASLPYLSHIVEYNQYYINNLMYARANEHEIATFRAEHMCYSPFIYRERSYVCNPDAYMEYFVGDEGEAIFLEWDRASYSPSIFEEKQARYRAFYASGEFERYGYTVFPTILTVAPTMARCERLKAAIERVDRTDICWRFSTPDQLIGNGRFLEAHRDSLTHFFE